MGGGAPLGAVLLLTQAKTASRRRSGGQLAEPLRGSGRVVRGTQGRPPGCTQSPMGDNTAPYQALYSSCHHAPGDHTRGAAAARTANRVRRRTQWTTYHHDPGRSGFDPEAGEPITPVLDWQSVRLDGPIWGQPLLLGSRVYVATTADGVYALDASSGHTIWHVSAGTPVPPGNCSAATSPRRWGSWGRR